MPQLVDRKNVRYGSLVALRRVKNDSAGNARWSCKCDCGNITTVLGQQLTKGQRSCGCSLRSHLRPYESLYNRLKTMTKHKVDLTYEEFEELTKRGACHYCGIPLVWRARYAGRGGWQLDRKDTKGAYSVGNCVVCCKRCNWGKGSLFTYEEWLQIGNLIRSWRSK